MKGDVFINIKRHHPHINNFFVFLLKITNFGTNKQLTFIMRHTLLLIMACLVFTTCRRTSPQEKILLSRADSIKEIYPDSAFQLLKKIKNPNILCLSDRALYALLMSEEMDRTGQFTESDSLIGIATRYYSKNSEAERAGYAYLYLSRVERNRGNANERIDALFQAISYANKSKSEQLLGYIYGEKANIYETQQVNSIKEVKGSAYEAQQRDSMLYYHKLSLQAFEKAGDRFNIIISLINIGYTYYLCQRYDSALHYTQQAEQDAVDLNAPILLSTIYRLTEGIYYYQKNYPKALQAIRLAMQTSDMYDYNKWRLIAMIYVQTGQSDSAAHYLNKCIATGNELPECYQLYQELAEKKGQLREALHYAKLSALAKDSVDERTRAESFAGMEKKYNNELMVVENKKLIIRNQRYIITLILVLLVCLVVMIFYFLEHAHKKKLAVLEKNLSKTIVVKDKFFSIISHDLRNPFKAINLVTHSLYENFAVMSETEKLSAIRAVCDTSEQAGKLLENLLLWSLAQKIDIPYRAQKIALAEPVNSSIDLLTLTAQKKGIQIVNNLTETYWVEADTNMMITILGNLINNAIKFSYPGTSVIISAKTAGDKVEVSVSDSGTGISAEDQLLLFRLDTVIKQTGTQNEQGTGMGLILCREFVEKQGGTIRVESQPGKGSTFIFTVLKATDHETN
jgi:signal transduction histidine kinase